MNPYNVTGPTAAEVAQVERKRAGGIIAVEDGYTSDSAIAGITYGIPVILGAKNAHDVLLEGQEVTIDGERGKVFAGIANAR